MLRVFKGKTVRSTRGFAVAGDENAVFLKMDGIAGADGKAPKAVGSKSCDEADWGQGLMVCL